MSLTPFHTVITCLRLEDIPGTASLFEREIEWAVHSLESIPATEFALILVDELFHGTNPNDSLIASNIYLKRLWEVKNALSIISTHQFKLLGNNKIQYFCCPASKNDDGTLNYTYELKEGICRLSSVNDILIEKGLCGKSDV
jgi:DNA mismatch repair ATPase MutS